MEKALQFLVMVDVELDRESLLGLVFQRFPGAIQRKEHSCDVRGNWLEIWDNDDADPDAASDEEDGFLYYRWRVEATPMAEHVDEDHQVALARELRDCFAKAGARAVVCASFEDRL